MGRSRAPIAARKSRCSRAARSPISMRGSRRQASPPNRSIAPAQRSPEEPPALPRIGLRKAWIEHIVLDLLEQAQPSHRQYRRQKRGQGLTRNRAMPRAGDIEMVARQRRDLSRRLRERGRRLQLKERARDIEIVAVGHVLRQKYALHAGMKRHRRQQSRERISNADRAPNFDRIATAHVEYLKRKGDKARR